MGSTQSIGPSVYCSFPGCPNKLYPIKGDRYQSRASRKQNFCAHCFAFQNLQHLAYTKITLRESSRRIQEDFVSTVTEAAAAEHSQDPEFALVPLVDGKYKILTKLGEGSYGRVFKVLEESTKRILALKVVSVKKLESDKWNPDREPELMRKLAHAHIVKLERHWRGTIVVEDPLYSFLRLNPNDPYEAMEFSFILMEFCSSSLESLLERGPLPLNVVIMIAIQVFEALAHIHAKGILHRDIKPANIFVIIDHKLLETDPMKALSTLVVKIGDFGIGRFLQKKSLASTEAGTLSYAAGEMVKDENGEGYTHKIDVYAAAIVIMQLITGMPSGEYGQHFDKIYNAELAKFEASPDEIAAEGPRKAFKTIHKLGLVLKFVKKQVPQACLRPFLQKLLDEEDRRPTAAEVLKLPLMSGWRFISNPDPNCKMAGLVDGPESIAPALAGLHCTAVPVIYKRSLAALKALLESNTSSSPAWKKVKEFVESEGIETVLTQCASQMNIPEGQEDWMSGLRILEFAFLRGDRRATTKMRQQLRQTDVAGLISKTKVYTPTDQAQQLTTLSLIAMNDPTLCKAWKELILQTGRSFIQTKAAAAVPTDLVGNTKERAKMMSAALSRCMPSLAAEDPDLFNKCLQQLYSRDGIPACWEIEPKHRAKVAPYCLAYLFTAIRRRLLPASKDLIDTKSILRALVRCVRVFGTSTAHGPLLAAYRHSCSRTVLGTFPEPMQYLMLCKTCWADSKKGCCLQCGASCHFGHKTSIILCPGGFVCECASRPGKVCNCSRPDAPMSPLLNFRPSEEQLTANISPSAGIDDNRSGGSLTVASTRDRRVLLPTDFAVVRLSPELAQGPERTLFYFELKITNGGPQDGIELGICNVKPAVSTAENERVVLDCSNGEVTIKEHTGLKVTFPYSGTGGTDSVFGCGQTTKGRVFFTRDRLMLPIVPGSSYTGFTFDVSKEQVLFALVGLRGVGTAVQLNFGERPFELNFDPLPTTTFPDFNATMPNARALLEKEREKLFQVAALLQDPATTEDIAQLFPK